MSKIKVVVVEPKKGPYIKEINNELKEYQSLVEGYIETVALYNDDCLVVLNEEGKLQGLEPNRAICDVNLNILDVLVGTFLITAVDVNGEFRSLTEKETKKYLELCKNKILPTQELFDTIVFDVEVLHNA